MEDPDFPDGDEALELPPSPGERLLYALGQLYRHWYRCELDLHPRSFDVMDLASNIGVSNDIEMVTEDLLTFYHLPAEVLVVDRRQHFPWRLLSVEDWAAEQDRASA